MKQDQKSKSYKLFLGAALELSFSPEKGFGFRLVKPQWQPHQQKAKVAEQKTESTKTAPQEASNVIPLQIPQRKAQKGSLLDIYV